MEQICQFMCVYCHDRQSSHLVTFVELTLLWRDDIRFSLHNQIHITEKFIYFCINFFLFIFKMLQSTRWLCYILYAYCIIYQLHGISFIILKMQIKALLHLQSACKLENILNAKKNKSLKLKSIKYIWNKKMVN